VLTKYGRDVIITTAIIIIIVVVAASFIDVAPVRWGIWLIAGLFAAFTLYFFRDPERSVPPEANGNANVVVSPGDGKVVQIVETEERQFFGGKVTQVSIFLSPLNVHVNRIPLSGTVTFFRYIKGDYIVAFHEKASEKNERTEIGIENGSTKVLFKQIAGYVARRIVCPIKEGDAVTIGERCGMIKFGSRVDVLFPPDSEIRVKIGDVVCGGETIVGVVRS